MSITVQNQTVQIVEQNSTVENADQPSTTVQIVDEEVSVVSVAEQGPPGVSAYDDLPSFSLIFENGLV